MKLKSNANARFDEVINFIFSLSIPKIVLLFLLSTCYNLLAQETVIFYDMENSPLPSNDITAITFDNEGNSWIGTRGGLVFFDGINWTVFDKNNSGLPENFVNAVNIDSKGNVWIGSRGLVKYDGTNWTIFNEDNSGLTQNYVSEIGIDKDDNLWLGSFYGGGLIKYDGTNWTTYRKSNSNLSGDWINSIFPDKDGNIWIAVEGGGVVWFDGKNWLIYDKSTSNLTSTVVSALAIDNDGVVWIGMETWETTSTGGVAKFDGSNWTIYSFPTINSLTWVLPITSLAIDSQNCKWIGSFSMGMGKFIEPNWTMYTSVNSGWPFSDGITILSSNKINNIAVDQYNNVWICSDDAGLCIFNETGVVDVNNSTSTNQPTEYNLGQNYPNPFNPTTTIKYAIPKSSQIKLIVYNSLGEEVKELINEFKSAGEYEVKFEAENLPSGVYFYIITSGNNTITRKMLLLK